MNANYKYYNINGVVKFFVKKFKKKYLCEISATFAKIHLQILYFVLSMAFSLGLSMSMGTYRRIRKQSSMR